MKKKIIITIISIVSILTAGIGGFLIGNNLKNVEPPIVIERDIHRGDMIQLLYGCPNSRKNSKRKVERIHEKF